MIAFEAVTVRYGRREVVAGFTTRSIEYFTSLAVSGLPSWNVTPSCSVNVKTVASSLTSTLAARFGTTSVLS